MYDFANLIAPFEPNEFFELYYQKQALHVPGNLDKFNSIMSWEILNKLLSINALWTPDNLKLYQDLNPIPPEEYCRSLPSLNGLAQQPDPELVKAKLVRGASLVLNSIDTFTTEMKHISDMLEALFHGYAQLNLYCSFSGHQAFGSHFDTHEVFAIHVEGEKTWRLWEGRLDNPISHSAFLDMTSEQHKKKRGKLLREVRLKPGDFLYIPRGQYHDALASSEACVHLTYGVIPVRGIDIFELLENEATAHSLFRQDLPSPNQKNGETLTERLSQISDIITTMLQDPNIVDSIVQRQSRFRGIRGTYQLPMVPKTCQFNVRVNGLKVVRRGNRYFLRSSNAGIPIPSGAQELVSWVIEHPTFMDSEVLSLFGHLGSQRVKELLKQLQKMELIKPSKV